MKNFRFALLLGVISILVISCSRVAPNYQGVLMENFGQNGKSDFALVKGRVNTAAPGTELFQVPLFEQRGGFEEPLRLKASNNTEFTATPKYSYEVIEERAIDVVFMGKRLDSGGDEFMDAIEDNIIEPMIDDMIKEYSRAYHTDTLMSEGGQLRFEKDLETRLQASFEEKGLNLLTFQGQLAFTEKVTDKIDQRNEVDANISVIDRQIQEQIKLNELEQLKTENKRIKDAGLTPKLLHLMMIQKWDGKTPLYADNPIFYKPVN